MTQTPQHPPMTYEQLKQSHDEWRMLAMHNYGVAKAAEEREQQLKAFVEKLREENSAHDFYYGGIHEECNDILSTLYPDTPAQLSEEKLPEWTKVKSREDGQIYTIHDATETNNQFGYGIYRYRVKERLDTGFALHKKWFDVISDNPAPKEGE
ncbi:hypothetical protein [Paenibacillus sp. FSL H8-0260]|uniref:hypothetical protein n=1 Tax=Paenibacillus sp. FSL H8-0260 TaxID=2921380 RepID=UPI003250837F